MSILPCSSVRTVAIRNSSFAGARPAPRISATVALLSVMARRPDEQPQGDAPRPLEGDAVRPRDPAAVPAGAGVLSFLDDEGPPTPDFGSGTEPTLSEAIAEAGLPSPAHEPTLFGVHAWPLPHSQGPQVMSAAGGPPSAAQEPPPAEATVPSSLRWARQSRRRANPPRPPRSLRSPRLLRSNSLRATRLCRRRLRPNSLR